MQTDFREWIKFEGVDKVAAALGVEPNTVYSWVHRNRIPYRLWPRLVQTFSKIGLSDLQSWDDAGRAGQK